VLTTPGCHKRSYLRIKDNALLTINQGHKPQHQRTTIRLKNIQELTPFSQHSHEFVDMKYLHTESFHKILSPDSVSLLNLSSFGTSAVMHKVKIAKKGLPREVFLATTFQGRWTVMLASEIKLHQFGGSWLARSTLIVREVLKMSWIECVNQHFSLVPFTFNGLQSRS